VQRELEQALTRYTEEHPKVKELRASLVALEKESSPTKSAAKPSARSNVQLAELNSRRTSLREQLKKSQAAEEKSRRTIQKFATNEVAFARFQSEYSAQSTRRDELVQARVLVSSKATERWRQSDRAEIARIMPMPRIRDSALAGLSLGAVVLAAAIPIRRSRGRIIRDENGLRKATGLPVVKPLPNLHSMDAAQREFWAVETLDILRRAAGVERRGCFVCGLISANHGEGRSTWIDLLSQAALRNGNRVLVVGRPSVAPDLNSNVPDPAWSMQNAGDAGSDLLVSRSSPGEQQALARYDFPGTIEHVRFQKYWERALKTWETEENAVILIELPPATSADALLLASAVPNLLWISAANRAESEATAECVSSLRNTGCNLIGAGLNISI
jgi:hypothetical protein